MKSHWKKEKRRFFIAGVITNDAFLFLTFIRQFRFSERVVCFAAHKMFCSMFDTVVLHQI